MLFNNTGMSFDSNASHHSWFDTKNNFERRQGDKFAQNIQMEYVDW